MAYNRGAVRTRLRVLSLRMSFGGDLSGGGGQGALPLRAYVSHYFEVFLLVAWAMMGLVHVWVGRWMTFF